MKGNTMATNQQKLDQIAADVAKLRDYHATTHGKLNDAADALAAILAQLTNVPLPGGGVTDSKTKIAWQAHEFHQLKGKVDAMRAEVKALTSALNESPAEAPTDEPEAEVQP